MIIKPKAFDLHQLSLAGKFCILGVLSVLMLLLPTGLYMREKSHAVAIAERELQAIAPVAALNRVVQLTQTHRGMAAGALAGNTALAERRVPMRDSVLAAMTVVESALSQAGASATLVTHWARLREAWVGLERDVSGQQLDPAQSTRRHTDLLAQWLVFNEELLAEYGLIHDPDPATHYLIDASLVSMPALGEKLGVLRAQGTGYLARGRLQAADQASLLAAVERVQRARDEFFRHLQRAIGASPVVKTALGSQAATQRASVDQDLALVSLALLHPGQNPYSALDYFNEFTASIDNLYTFNTLATHTLKQALQDRVSAMRQVQAGMAAVLLMGLTGGVALALAFIRSITTPVAEALEVARAVSDGHLDVAVPVRGSNELGQLMQTLSTMRDHLVSAQSRLEHQKFALDQHAIVAIANVQGTITYVNDRFCQISGYTREELLGQDHAIVNSGHHAKGFFKAMYQTVGRGEVWRGDVCNRAKNGSHYWVQTTVVPTFDSCGRPIEYIAIRADITARKEAEQALLRHQYHLAELVDQKTAALQSSMTETQNALLALEQQRFVIDEHAIVTICGVDGRIVYGNDKFSAVSGFSRDEFMGQDHRLINSGYHPKGFFKEMYETVARGEVWHAEVCNRAKDGHLYWVASTTAAFMDGEGKPRQFISVRTDITARKQAEESAKAASRAKAEFLANMSHEIRTPMNGVVGMVDILQQTELAPAQRRMLGTINDSSLALLHIINDILDYSKIEAGKLDVECIPMHLHGVAEGVVQLMSTAAKTKSIELSVSVAPDLPQWALGDPNRLRQVLLNLLSNALKFTANHPDRRGRVALRVDTVTRYDGTRGVNLRIGDNGIGMSAEVVAKLFQPFTQADQSTARKFGGSGLGLSITQRLVELMQGRITISSTPGVGSEFVVELPLRPCDADLAQAEEMAERRVTARTNSTGREKASARSELILLAEDNETNRDVMQEQLRLQGYACEVAEDGALALALWQNNPGRYALLLTDCHMPNLDGFGLTQAIRAQEPAGTRLPIIAVTANAMQGEGQRCRERGMDDYLSKPLRMLELAAMLDKWLPVSSFSPLEPALPA
jgi:PAS domain S-box-containing protein